MLGFGVCNGAAGDNKKVPIEVPKARRCEYDCGESSGISSKCG